MNRLFLILGGVLLVTGSAYSAALSWHGKDGLGVTPWDLFHAAAGFIYGGLILARVEAARRQHAARADLVVRRLVEAQTDLREAVKLYRESGYRELSYSECLRITQGLSQAFRRLHSASTTVAGDKDVAEALQRASGWLRLFKQTIEQQADFPTDRYCAPDGAVSKVDEAFLLIAGDLDGLLRDWDERARQ